MKRPEKKEEVEFIEDNMNKDDCYNNGFDIGLADGYNASCDDHDKFLPSEEEINDIINEYVEENQISQPRLANAIAKRLGVK